MQERQSARWVDGRLTQSKPFIERVANDLSK